jgi:hypothetical protein
MVAVDGGDWPSNAHLVFKKQGTWRSRPTLELVMYEYKTLKQAGKQGGAQGLQQGDTSQTHLLDERVKWGCLVHGEAKAPAR